MEKNSTMTYDVRGRYTYSNSIRTLKNNVQAQGAITKPIKNLSANGSDMFVPVEKVAKENNSGKIKNLLLTPATILLTGLFTLTFTSSKKS